MVSFLKTAARFQISDSYYKSHGSSAYYDNNNRRSRSASSKPASLTTFNSYYKNEKNDSSNENGGEISTNSSTLSLHIQSYDFSDNDCFDTVPVEKVRTKYMDEISKSFMDLDFADFEFPRQQNDEAGVEQMKFRSSQRILTAIPSTATASSTKQSDAGPDAVVNSNGATHAKSTVLTTKPSDAGPHAGANSSAETLAKSPESTTKPTDSKLPDTGVKRKSFANYFRASPKIPKVAETTIFSVSSFEELLSTNYSTQKKTEIVFHLMDPEVCSRLEAVLARPLNFGLIDSRGVSVEAVVFDQIDKMRIINILKESSIDRGAVIINGWTFFTNSSTYKHTYVLHHKIQLNASTEIRLLGRNQLTDPVIRPFTLSSAGIFFNLDRSVTIMKTSVMAVAKSAVEFYSSYYGLLLCDGRNFCIAAFDIKFTSVSTLHAYAQDTKIELEKVNGKFLNVPQYKFRPGLVEYFLLDEVVTVPVFYVGQQSTVKILPDDTPLLFDEDFDFLEYPPATSMDGMLNINQKFRNLKM